MSVRNLVRTVLILAGAAVRVHAADPFAGADDPLLIEALAELDAAGVLPEAEVSSPPEQGGASPWSRWRSGSIRWNLRTEPTDEAGWDPRWSGAWNIADWSGRASVQRRAGNRALRGRMSFRYAGVQSTAGDLGLEWGAGMLASGPSRRSGMYAGTRLLRWRFGASSGGSAPAEQAISGVLLVGHKGPWSVLALGGRPQGALAPEVPWRGAVGMQTGVGSGSIGVLVLREGSRLGGSVFATVERSGLKTRFEGTWSAPRHRGRGQRSLLGNAGYELPRNGAVEFLVAQADGGPWPGTGTRPAVLAADLGRGWAFRVLVHPSNGLRLAALAGRSRGRKAEADAAEQERALYEVDGRWRPIPGWWIDLRWRGQLDRKWEHSARFPWQPVSRLPDRLRGVWTVSVRRREGASEVRVLLRGQSNRDGLEIRTRRLAQVTFRRDLNHRLRMRCAGGVAWGGDADLVSAVSPSPGWLLPRHWGHWRRELLCGLEYRTGPVSWSLAASQRERTASSGLPAERAVWLGSRGSF